MVDRLKVCRDCGKQKSISDFYVKEKRRYSTRYTSRCRPCYYAWVYAKDKAQGFKWHGPKQKNGQARLKLNVAVLRGQLVKPKTCEGCGVRFPSRKLHGHHDDYRRPLVVRWLCDGCHRRHHSAASG